MGKTNFQLPTLNSWNQENEHLDIFSIDEIENIFHNIQSDYKYQVCSILWELQVENKYTYNAQNRYTFISQLYDRETRSVDISSMSHIQKQFLNGLLTENYPLIEVLRLIPWEDVMNINVFGIKSLNDTFGQEFVDILIVAFKNLIKKEVQSNQYYNRVVKDDYKNLSIAGNMKSLEDFFESFHSKSELLELVLFMIDDDIEKLSQKRSYTKQEIYDVIYEYFNFWVWKSQVENNGDNLSRLQTIHHVEIASKEKFSVKDAIQIVEYNETEVMSNIDEVLVLRKEFVEKYTNTTFKYWWVEYSTIVQLGEKKFINNLLLRYIRKYYQEGKVSPKDLAYDMNHLLQKLNDTMDFVSPTTDIHLDLQKAEKINFIFHQKGNLDVEYIVQNYKWLTKEGLFSLTQKKKWIKTFIDIKDMWIENVADFLKRAEKISRLQEKNQFIQQEFEENIDVLDKNNDISLEYKHTKKQELLELLKDHTWQVMEEIRFLKLNAGMDVTNKFMTVTKVLKEKYPFIELSIWWDEIYSFIPWNVDESELINNVVDVFTQSWLKARITMDTSEHGWKKVYSQLDYFTNINKVFEEKIEVIIYKNNLVGYENVPRITSLHICDSVQEILLAMWDFQDIIESFLDEKELLEIIQSENIYNIWKNICNVWSFQILLRKHYSWLYEFKIIE